jgi:glycine/D-amino acid oxidase-like deaminating enzyme/nitrite reductase/ring-hydroxylating ferredoxin subunit
MHPRAPRPTSPWLETSPRTAYPRATDLEVDVAVVGGGLAGLTAAYLLKKAELRVAVLEKDRVAEGPSALTTAHLTWLLDRPLGRLRRDHGAQAGRVLEAHAAAIDEIERIVRTLGIECEFERVPGYRFGLTAGERRGLEKEVGIARGFGRSCEYVPAAHVPLRAPGGAMRLPAQAKFHPRKYLLGLAAHVEGEGSHVFEHSPVFEAVEMRDGWTVRTREAAVSARHLVLATYSPFGLKPRLQTRMEPMQTYVLAAEVPSGTLPVGLYWDTARPYHFLRVDAGAGHDRLLLGGADHRTGELRDTRRAHRSLEQYLRETLGVQQFTITHEWSGEVLEPVDGVAFIGHYPGPRKNRWVATGFSGNGMTHGTIAGILLRDLVLGVDNAWAHAFDPSRRRLRASAWQFLKTNADVARRFVSARLARAETDSIDDVPVGEGRMVRVEGRKLAVYRDERGTVTAMSPVCTHMGCIVDWNEKEKTWDCPCHGSRFAATGEVHTGPATTPLERVELGVSVPLPAPAR